MTVLSKDIFDVPAALNLTCAEVLHPFSTSCYKSLLHFVMQVGIGAPKFFLIIYLLQTITTRSKVNKKLIKSQILSYIRSLLYALCFGFNFHGSICLLRWCLRRFSYYSVIFGGTCAGLSIFVEDPKQRTLNTAIFVNLVAEVLVRYLYIEKYVKQTVITETFAFMVCSSLLMYLLKQLKPGTKVPNLWFYYPTEPPSVVQCPRTKEKCIHDGPCSVHFYEGITRYFCVGYSLQLLKYLLPRIDKLIVKPGRLIKTAFSRKMFLFGLMFGTFAGIYRVLTCWLFKKANKEKFWHPLLGGFLAGSSYVFKPTTSMLAIALTTTFQLLLQQVLPLKDLQAKFPAKELLFAMCTGVLIHSRFLRPELCPKYVIRMLRTVSNGEVDRACDTAIQTLNGVAKLAIS